MRSLSSLYKKVNSNFSIRLKSRLKEVMPAKLEELKEIKKLYGNKEVGTYTVDQVIGGMRDIKSVFYDTSILDKMTGITFRGYTIPDLVNHLPKAIPDGEPLPEGLFYLLMTGELPTDEDSNDIKEFWAKNG
jgi:citrate synthase